MLTPARALTVAIASAMLFACLAGARIDGPGLYYDEAHQAPAAFAWLGRTPGEHFALVPIGGVPWLTMPYSGAVKSMIYAALMSATGRDFTVASWRWLGIAFVVIGWVGCAAAIGMRFGLAAETVFVALLVTDVTVLLTTRHDWGPTTLALCLRFAFLTVWLRRDALTPGVASALGGIVGLAAFEKLSSLVLLAPLAVALWRAPRRTVCAALLGLGVGLLPLALVNVATWSRGDGWISLSRLHDAFATSASQFVRDFLSLGQGPWVRRWVFDLTVPYPLLWAEALLLTALVAIGWTQLSSRRLMLAYLAVGVALVLLPRRTQAHHWIIGTPFQYAGIAILVSRVGEWRRTACVLVALLLVLRLPALVDTTSAIAANRTAPRFDPGATRVATLLAARSDAFVVAATWGIANQIICFAQGRTDAVYEPIYEDNEVTAFESTLAHTNRAVLYLALVPRELPLFAMRTARVLTAIESDARWHEVASDVESTAEIRVRKFVRAAPAGATAVH